MTREIPQKDWPKFCQMVSEKYQGARVNIQVINGRVDKVAQDVQFQQMSLDVEPSACNNLLRIKMESTQYEVFEPIHMILRKPKGMIGAEHYHDLEIPSENGTTVITIHPGITVENVNAVCAAPRLSA